MSWSFLVNILFPVPLLYLVIVSLPLPQRFRVPIQQFSTKVFHKVLFFKISGVVTLYNLAVVTSFLLFIESGWQTSRANQRYEDAVHKADKDSYRGLKWRAERNFWIAFFSFVVWIILYRICDLIKENEDLRRSSRRD